jgi:hypothetical protein
MNKQVQSTVHPLHNNQCTSDVIITNYKFFTGSVLFHIAMAAADELQKFATLFYNQETYINSLPL